MLYYISLKQSTLMFQWLWDAERFSNVAMELKHNLVLRHKPGGTKLLGPITLHAVVIATVRTVITEHVMHNDEVMYHYFLGFSRFFSSTWETGDAGEVIIYNGTMEVLV